MDEHDNVVVVYHDPCLDGMASRYAAWKHYGNKATYMPGKYEEDVSLDKFEGKDIVCVDFSYKRRPLVQIAQVCRSLQVLDHHKTAVPEVEAAIEELKGTEHEGKIVFHYDAERSGVGIVWDVLHTGKPMPRVLWHIEDRDLWKFSLDHTKEVCCYMTSLKFDFKQWVKAVEQMNYRELVTKGRAIRLMEVADIEGIVKTAIVHSLHGYRVPVITNCPKEYVSEACNLLLLQEEVSGEVPGSGDWPYSVNRSWNGKGWLYSLRSNEHGIDVGALAKSYGGGGHRNASGFFMLSDPSGP